MSLSVPDTARLEIKFVTYVTELSRIESWLKMHWAGFYSPYPNRLINNVYFDNYDFSAYSENLLGASSRLKVRYRWYGPSEFPGKGSLELKFKRNSFGWKRRFRCSSPPSTKGMDWRDFRANLVRMIGPEARFWLDSNPQAVLLNRYERRYFVSDDGKVRATIDTDQRVFDQRYRPYPNVTSSANLPRTIVIEFKCHRDERQKMANIVQGFPVRVSRNSKYMIGLKSVQ